MPPTGKTGITEAMSKKVILVTGGQRSGKSGYAQRLALSLSPNPVYLATSRIWDEEFRKRVERHQRDRGPEWTNIEEEKYLSRHDLTGRVVVIDCVTFGGLTSSSTIKATWNYLSPSSKRSSINSPGKMPT